MRLFSTCSLLLPFAAICLVVAVSPSAQSAQLKTVPSSADETDVVTSGSAKKPNFVFLLVDDMGYTDVGCYGSTFYETPNIDKLAASGVRFTDAYSACPVCSPSRAAIMTGKYPARLGTTDYFGADEPEHLRAKHRRLERPLLPAHYKPYLEPSEVTIAEALKQDGYKTFMAGKWHLGADPKYGPLKQGFDVDIAGWKAGHPTSYFPPYKNPRLSDGPPGEYLTDRLASETVKFIEKNSDKPFFVYLPFYSVHIPLMGRPDLLKKYEEKRKRLGLDDEFTSDGAYNNRANQSRPVYGAMVEAVDQAVGRVLDSLKRMKIDDNTIVIFFSDNGGVSTAQGYPTSNLPLRTGKGWLYDGGIREPLIVKWPHVTKPGSVDHSVVIATDFYPTMLQMAGIPLAPEHHMDGVSLAGVLKNGDSLTRKDIYWHYPHYADQGGGPGSAVREGDWKLIRWYEGNRVELYNLKDDIGEKHDLAAARPEITKRLSENLDAWLKSMGAQFPTANPAYKGPKGPKKLKERK